MAYLTTAQILGYAARATQQNFSATEALVEKKASYQAFDVFLSHSSKDEARILGVVQFLRDYGVNVYIDKLDDELPKKTSPETGARLKQRINDCRKFIVLVSENSKDSKWIPWELGIGDETKTLRNVALLPTVDSSQNVDWPEQEYMGLYHRVHFGGLDGYNDPVWMVRNHHNNTAVELSKWLKR